MVYLIAVLLVLILFAVLSERGHIMEDFTKLNASIAKLQADVTSLIAATKPVPPVSQQPAIDAAQSAVDALDATVVAAMPNPPVTP